MNPENICYEWDGVDVRPLIDLYSKDRSFKDVVGLEYEINLFKRELFITEEQARCKESIGLNIMQSYLLYGPPGCGKTVLAETVASEYKRFCGGDVAIISLARPLTEPSPGKTEANIRALFAFADQFERSVLLLDQIDEISCPRKTDDREFLCQQIPALVQCITSYVSNPHHVLIATSSSPHLMDYRVPSHIVEKVEIRLPSKKDIAALLGRTIGNRIDPNVDLNYAAEELAKRRFTTWDVFRFLKALTTALFEDYMRDSKITTINGALMERILCEASSSISKADLEAIEEFKNIYG